MLTQQHLTAARTGAPHARCSSPSWFCLSKDFKTRSLCLLWLFFYFFSPLLLNNLLWLCRLELGGCSASSSVNCSRGELLAVAWLGAEAEAFSPWKCVGEAEENMLGAGAQGEGETGSRQYRFLGGSCAASLILSSPEKKGHSWATLWACQNPSPAHGEQ